MTNENRNKGSVVNDDEVTGAEGANEMRFAETRRAATGPQWLIACLTAFLSKGRGPTACP